MENIENKPTPQTCTGTGRIGHLPVEYGTIGISPCGEYVAHDKNIKCNVIETTELKESPPGPKTCSCRTDSCPCGDFISHKVYDPCPVILV